MLAVGLEFYISIGWTSTLSAGEAQRIKLAGLLGGELTSLTVLLDEPTRGLHPSEVKALLSAMADLRKEGNTVIVVEHDPLIMRAADYLIDMGPGSGSSGGQVVAQGTPEEMGKKDTLTGAWLRGERCFERIARHANRAVGCILLERGVIICGATWWLCPSVC